MRFSALWEPVKGKKSCQKLSLFGAEIARGHVTQTLILNFVKVMNNSNASRFSDKRSLSLFTHCVRKNNFLTKYYSIHIRFMYATQRDSDFFFKKCCNSPKQLCFISTILCKSLDVTDNTTAFWALFAKTANHEFSKKCLLLIVAF